MEESWEWQFLKVINNLDRHFFRPLQEGEITGFQ